MSLKSKVDQYDVLVKQLFELLDKTEESENGTIFQPNYIVSCHPQDSAQLFQILIELKHTMEDFG